MLQRQTPVLPATTLPRRCRRAGVLARSQHRVSVGGETGARPALLSAEDGLVRNAVAASQQSAQALLYDIAAEAARIRRSELLALHELDSALCPHHPISDGEHFLVRKAGRLYATPLLVALLAIETTDLVFAFDSIPAVFAVAREPFLVYISNVFELLGRRSLHLLLASAIQQLRFLRTALGIMLQFVAAKMLLSDVIEIPFGISLAVIGAIAWFEAAHRSIGPIGPMQLPPRPAGELLTKSRAPERPTEMQLRLG
jgi:Integral membrane protein TerC family